MKGLRTVRKIVTLCVLSCSVISAAPVSVAFAGGGGLSGGATEMTQMMNNSELATQVSKMAQQIQNQIQMIQDMVYNTLTIPDQLFSSSSMLDKL
ncbi:hypothetical protein AGMMS49957_17590 [Synergistales bacterium]|nr:hypothetical protein AGMMS49957_17590 [Synergistales bacterium]